MRLFFAIALVLFLSFSISCERRDVPQAAEAQAEKEPAPKPNLEGKYKVAYDYLSEHSAKDKPAGWISAIIVKKVAGLGAPNYQVRHILITETGELILMRDGSGFFGIDMDALFDVGDHVVFSPQFYGQNIWAVSSGSFKIIKKEAVSLNSPPAPATQ